jgi:DNA-binding winged helix-turn-helix (wHTH) protein
VGDDDRAREELLRREGHGEDVVDAESERLQNIVDRHIRSLRIKLKNDYHDPRFIATVPGRGYRFIPTFTNAGWDGEGDPGHMSRNRSSGAPSAKDPVPRGRRPAT